MNGSGAGAHGQTREEAIEILRSGFGLELMKIATSYVAPIFWADPSDADATLENGTIFFINRGAGVLGVTCDHVVRAWSRATASRPATRCQIYDLDIDLAERLIASDAKRDLATLRFTPEEVSGFGKWVFDATADWPPSPPEQGRGVFFSGFPNNYVRELEPRVFEFGTYMGLGVATVVAEDRIVYQFEREHFIDSLGSGLPPANEYLGGLSGAALWTLVTPPCGALSWRLAGVIYEWSMDFELLYARPLNELQPGGHFPM